MHNLRFYLEHESAAAITVSNPHDGPIDLWFLTFHNLPHVSEARQCELFDDFTDQLERAAMGAWDELVQDLTGAEREGWKDEDLPRLTHGSPGLIEELRAHAARLWCRRVGAVLLEREAREIAKRMKVGRKGGAS